jgi:hypothetical protein
LTQKHEDLKDENLFEVFVLIAAASLFARVGSFREKSGIFGRDSCYPHFRFQKLLTVRFSRAAAKNQEVRKATMPQSGMKQLGRQAAASGLQQANVLLHLVIKLRSGRPFIPKGVHRFCSYEEAQQWSIRMQAGKTSPDHLL